MTEICFEGVLGIEDMSRHVPLAFHVPEGTRTLRIAFEHDPHHPGIGPLPHQLSISVYGPDGARGTRHNNADQSPVISERWASPGYTAGPIEPGEWVVEIDTARILAPGKVSYTLTVATDAASTEGPAFPDAAPVASRGPGWYRGDLHGHSHHSDGKWPVADFIAHARNRGLDFVTLSDHNTVSGLPEALSLAGDDLLVMRGVELTTFNGHCLALGTGAWVDWRIKDGQSMAERAEAIMGAGLTYVIAHPMSLGHPWCTGCHWAYADVFPGPARLCEIWNSAWDGHKNELGLKLFRSWLDKGFRMRATAGTDIHGPTGREVRVGYNRVRAEALREDAILAGLRAGHNVLSAGPVLEMVAVSGGTEAQVGDLLERDSADLYLRWADAPEGAQMRLVTGAGVAADWAAEGQGTRTVPMQGMPSGAWVMAEMRCAAGDMLAVTNPVFFPGDWR